MWAGRTQPFGRQMHVCLFSFEDLLIPGHQPVLSLYCRSLLWSTPSFAAIEPSVSFSFWVT